MSASTPDRNLALELVRVTEAAALSAARLAGRAPAPPRAALDGAGERAAEVGGHPGRLREHPLADAQSSLRPVRELSWETGELALRLTAQGPWQVDELLAIAASVSG